MAYGPCSARPSSTLCVGAINYLSVNEPFGASMSLPPFLDLQALLHATSPFVLETGAIILSFYQSKSFGIREKSDGTPVTDADQAAHAYITHALSQRFPQIPIVSEEDTAPTTEHYPLYWCIDPLDGTKEFIRGSHGEFTVNLALIWQGAPILGIVYVPVEGALFYATHQHGAFRQIGSQPPVPIHTRKFPAAERVWLVSRSHDPQKLAPLQRAWNLTLVPMSSSLKHCYIAQGKGDLYVRRGPTGQWDTAATQCIVEEAGGKVIDLSSKQPLRYKSSQNENPHLAFCGDQDLDLSIFYAI